MGKYSMTFFIGNAGDQIHRRKPDCVPQNLPAQIGFARSGPDQVEGVIQCKAARKEQDEKDENKAEIQRKRSFSNLNSSVSKNLLLP